MADLPNCKLVKKPNWSKSRPFADDLVVKSLDDCSTAESFTECVASGGVGHGLKGTMGKKSKTAHLHLTFALFTSLVTP